MNKDTGKFEHYEDKAHTLCPAALDISPYRIWDISLLGNYPSTRLIPNSYFLVKVPSRSRQYGIYFLPSHSFAYLLAPIICQLPCQSLETQVARHSLPARPCGSKGGSCPGPLVPGTLHPRPSIQRTVAPSFSVSKASHKCRSSGSENLSFHLHYGIFSFTFQEAFGLR